MDKYIGKLLDERYEIKSMLGQGGMAVVYSAFDIIDKKNVAIKILREEFLKNDDFIKRFNNESKAIAVLSHPNIVKIFDFSFGDKIQYIVMENIDGITLKEYIEQRQKLPWKEALYFVVQILKALSHAHNSGVIHRDIKPQNIMLLRDGTIKVTDFGIAKFSDQKTQTMTDKAIGSVHYISPEQAKGEMTTEKSDLYSVGIILYEMLTGRVPFEADNAVSVAIMQLQTSPKPLCQLDREIPEGLEEITLKALQKKPKYRYDSAQEMLFAIDEFRKNPTARFEYKYFADNSATRYMDAIDNVRMNKGKFGYNDEYKMTKSKKNRYSNAVSIVVGVGIALVLFATVLVCGLFTNWFGFGAKDVEVPLLIGQKINEVYENRDYKFNWHLEYAYDATKAEGVILDQDPKAYSKKVKEDAIVTLYVNSSSSKVVVPMTKGKTEEIAKSELRAVGLAFEVISVEDAETPAGVVINSDPPEGKEITANSVVKLYVSRGAAEKKVVVPNVIGKTLVDASNTLTLKGLKISPDIVKENSPRPKDEVLATDPLPGIEVAEGSTVVLTVSSGELAEKKVQINVDLPASVSKEVSIKVYINGVLDASLSKAVIPAYHPTYTFSIVGTTGTKSVLVNLDNTKYRLYEVDFDKESVKTVAAHEYQESSSSKGSAASTKAENASEILYKTNKKIFTKREGDGL